MANCVQCKVIIYIYIYIYIYVYIYVKFYLTLTSLRPNSYAHFFSLDYIFDTPFSLAQKLPLLLN